MKKKFRNIILATITVLITTFIYSNEIETNNTFEINNFKIAFNLIGSENNTLVVKENEPENIVTTSQLEDLPIIKASLFSEKEVILNKNEVTTIKYNISPEDFEINNSNEKDVVIVIDVSKDMQIEPKNITESIFGKIINTDKMKSYKTEYDFITFSNEIKEVIDLKYSSYENYQSYITDLNDNYLKKKIEIDKPNAKNIKVTYEKIIELLDNGRVGAGKNVIFISSTNNVSYESKDIEKLRQKKYNIITLAIENTNNNNKDNHMKKLHEALNGLDDNYFYTSDLNEISNNIMEKIAERLISGISYESFIFNPVMQLDLGDNFEAVSGIEKVEGNIATIKVPTSINYNYSKEDKKYHGNKVEVEFTIKPKDNKVGFLSFGKDNKLLYKSLTGENDKYSIITETPIIKVKQDIKGLEHGLYEGVKNNSIELYNQLEGNETIISTGATVIFGAKFITSNDDFELNLNADSNFNKIQISDIKVYKLDKTNNSLIEITNSKGETNEKKIVISDLGENKFTVKANNLNNDSKDTEIVIVYKGRMKDDIENEYLINSVTISDLNAEVKIKTGSSSNSNTEDNEKDYQGVLPDLF